MGADDIAWVFSITVNITKTRQEIASLKEQVSVLDPDRLQQLDWEKVDKESLTKFPRDPSLTPSKITFLRQVAQDAAAAAARLVFSGFKSPSS